MLNFLFLDVRLFRQMCHYGVSLQEGLYCLLRRLRVEVATVRKPEPGRHKGDLGGSVAKTGVRAGLSPQCLCGNNQVNFTSLIIMFEVFLCPILANVASKWGSTFSL